MTRVKDISVPFADQVVWPKGLELVKDGVDFPISYPGVLGERDESLGWTWLEIVE